jgi:hypothetical protein
MGSSSFGQREIQSKLVQRAVMDQFLIESSQEITSLEALWAMPPHDACVGPLGVSLS